MLASTGGIQEVLKPILGPTECTPPDLTGKVAVVTGGALGIGYEVARSFIKAGARVILVNRKEEQGDEAIKKLKEETGGAADVEWIGCDLGSLKQTKEVFDGIAEKEDRLDLLILSAGINSDAYDEDSDGIDRHFGVNWLGHFLVLNRLYPLLRKTASLPGNSTPPRVVLESSEMHRGAPSAVQFKTIEEINNDKLGPVERYGRSKLAMILGARYLRDHVIKPNGDNIYITSVHPGVVNTDMQESWKRGYPGLLGQILTPLNYFAGRSVEQGAYSGIYAATDPEVIEKELNGAYFSDPAKWGDETEQAKDMGLAADLWDLSTRLVQQKLGEDALKPWDK